MTLPLLRVGLLLYNICKYSYFFLLDIYNYFVHICTHVCQFVCNCVCLIAILETCCHDNIAVGPIFLSDNDMGDKERDLKKQREDNIKEEIDDVTRTESIIRETIYVKNEESGQYFINGIINISNQQYLVGGRVKNSFVKLLIDDSHDSKALNYLKQWLDR